MINFKQNEHLCCSDCRKDYYEDTLRCYNNLNINYKLDGSCCEKLCPRNICEEEEMQMTRWERIQNHQLYQDMRHAVITILIGVLAMAICAPIGMLITYCSGTDGVVTKHASEYGWYCTALYTLYGFGAYIRWCFK